MIHIFLAGEEEIASRSLPKTIAFNVNGPDNNTPILELDDYPNYVQEKLVDKTMSTCEHKDNVDIHIPSTSMTLLYSRSPKLVSAIRTEVEQTLFHKAPLCQPLIVDLPEEAIRDKQSQCRLSSVDTNQRLLS